MHFVMQRCLKIIVEVNGVGDGSREGPLPQFCPQESGCDAMTNKAEGHEP